MGFITDTKDRLAEKAALAWLNASLLRPYGRATRLRINSRAKTVELAIELKGEAQPVEIFISKYELTADHGCVYVMLNGIRTSREWLTSLAERQVASRRFELPAPIGGLVLKYF